MAYLLKRLEAHNKSALSEDNAELLSQSPIPSKTLFSTPTQSPSAAQPENTQPPLFSTPSRSPLPVSSYSSSFSSLNDTITPNPDLNLPTPHPHPLSLRVDIIHVDDDDDEIDVSAYLVPCPSTPLLPTSAKIFTATPHSPSPPILSSTPTDTLPNTQELAGRLANLLPDSTPALRLAIVDENDNLK